MSRIRNSPALVVAFVALAIAVISGGTAVAATVITGAQIKNRSITKVDVATNTLTGAEINEAKLGAVPLAGNAGKLGGLPASGFARSSQILRGSANIDTAGVAPSIMFTDPGTGLRVGFLTGGRLYVQNTGKTPISIVGEGHYATDVYTTKKLLAPGADSYITYDASGFSFGTFVVTTQPASVAQTRLLQLTCSADYEVSPAPARMSCVGVR